MSAFKVAAPRSLIRFINFGFKQYRALHPDVTIDYQAMGSGAGIKGITTKAFDFAGSDAPMSKKELDEAGGASNLIEIPTVAGAVVVAYNLPGLQGEVKTGWADARGNLSWQHQKNGTIPGLSP